MEKKRDQGLDILRCFAILAVLFLHSIEAAPLLPESLKYWFSFGWIGVDLFFVLSGFLIGSQVMQTPVSVGLKEKIHVFWAKRWFRTLPLYFVVLIFYIILKPTLMGAEFKPIVWPFFFFLQNYFPLTDFVQSWSICIEEQFYIILPLLSFVLFPRAIKSPYFWICVSIGGFFLRLFLLAELPPSAIEAEIDYHIRFPLYTHFDGLSAGLFLSSTASVWSVWKTSTKVICSLVGGIGLVIVSLILGPHLTVENVNYYFTLLPIFFAFLLVGFKGFCGLEHLSFLISWVALLSYGAYLWNNLLIRFFARYLSDLNWQTGLILFLVSTHIVAFGTYVLIEKPFLILRSKYLRSRFNSKV